MDVEREGRGTGRGGQQRGVYESRDCILGSLGREITTFMINVRTNAAAIQAMGEKRLDAIRYTIPGLVVFQKSEDAAWQWVGLRKWVL